MKSTMLNVNGKIFTRAEAETRPEARISVFDRAYLYGDSLYEVCRTYQGKLFAVPEHLQRLGRSAELCKMSLAQPLSQYAAEMQRTVDEFFRQASGKSKEAYVRLIVSRGIGRIGFGLPCVETPTQFVIIAQPLDEPSDAQLRKGFALQTSARLRNDRRALDPAMKSGNYLNSLLAYLDAAALDFDDAILCNAEEHVTEGTTFNIGYLRRGILATPPLDIGILDGITRRMLIRMADTLDIPVREVRFPRERLYEADEVFMCSTIKEVFPVTRVDGHRIGKGTPGALTLKLRQAFHEAALKRTHT